MKNVKKTIILVILFTSILLACLIMSFSGIYTAKTEKDYRCFKLLEWHEQIEQYIDKNNANPKSLYEVAVSGDEIFPYLKVTQLQPIDFVETGDKLTDPNYFNNIVEYEILTGMNRWYIIELKHGEKYTKKMMIDQNSNIYVLTSLK